MEKYIQQILRESLTDFDIALPPIKTKNDGDGGNDYRIFAYYGDLYLPKGFIRLLNDDVQYPGTKFLQDLNGLHTAPFGAIWDSSNYSSNTKNREKFVVDGFYKTMKELSREEGRQAFLELVYTTMSHFNTGKTLSDDDIINMLKSAEFRFDMTEFDNAQKIIDIYF